MDNGQTLIDLARYFMGSEFAEAEGYRSTLMWPVAPVEDNAFALFRTADNRTAMLQSSWTQWKGSLYLEVFGTEGYVIVDYETSQTRVGKRSEHWLPVQEEIFDLSTVPERSLALEWQDFVSALRGNRTPSAGGYDGWRAVVMAHAIYESSETGKAVRLP
jgi:myo-inositol 2-dehydrogenase/D-chiro-inositol 1-dehydrogenase